MERSRPCSADRCRWRGLQAVLLALCAGVLLSGCGGDGGEENKLEAPVDQEPKLTGMPVKPRVQPKPSRDSQPKKLSSKRSRRIKKPPGIPIEALPDEQFTITGNADQFAPADEPFDTSSSFIAHAPDASLTSSNYLAAVPDSSRESRRAVRTRLPQHFEPVPDAGVSDDGWPLRIICRKDESEMVFIPAGLFTRGAEEGPDDARPQHQVQLDSYYIDVHEVTAEQYQRYRRDLSANNERLPKALDPVDDLSLPAVGVRWGEAIQYARWAGKDLPTEAEWEKAARGNDAYTYPWGNGKPIWHRSRELAQIDPVESFRGDRSPFGVMDLAGNAREWCQDWYSARAYQMALDQANAATLLNPDGPRTAVGSEDRTVRVVRGSEQGWEAWRRSGIPMGTRSPTIGFRCVLRVNQAQSEEPLRKETAEKKGKGF